MKKLLTFLLTALLAFGVGWAETVDDVLNRALTGITNGSTTYANWSGKTSNSTAVYAGNSAGGNDAIQLRSDKSTSGIVTTASGGKVKKITVVWQSNTASGRTLNIYGKSSAYSAATDLYNNSSQGTLLGTIVRGTAETGSYTINTGDYEYIGLRSNSGAMYLTSVTITWETGGSTVETCATPTFSPAEGSYTEAQNVTISCATSGATIHYTTDGSTPTTNSPVYSSAINVSSTTTIKAIATATGYNSSDVATATYTITEPAATVTYEKITSTSDLKSGDYLIVYEDGNLAFDGSLSTLDVVGNSKSVTITNDEITTSDNIYFTYDATAGTLKSASGYYIGQTTNENGLATSTNTTYANAISFDNGNADIVSSNAHLRYNSASNQTRFRYFKSSSYTNQKAIQLYRKKSTDPTLTVSPATQALTDIPYNAAVGTTTTGTITVTGEYLTGNVTVSISGADFSVSPTTLTPDADGSLNATVTVTYSGTSTTEVTGTVTVTCGDLTETATVTAKKETPPAPSLTVNPSTLNINDDNTSGAKTGYFTVTGTNIGTDNVGVDVLWGNFSRNAGEYGWGFVNNNGSVSGTAYVTYTGKALGAHGRVQASNNLPISATVDVNYLYTGHIYIMGTVNDTGWAANNGVLMDRNASTGIYSKTLTLLDSGNDYAYISFTKTLANGNEDWAAIAGDRFGPESNGNWDFHEQFVGQPCALDTTGGYWSIKLPAGDWEVTINPRTNSFTLVPHVPAPVFTPEGGRYETAQTVEITCTNGDAHIYYTTDGTEPTANSTPYTGPITVTAESTTLKAIAIYGNYSSTVTEATYTIKPIGADDFILVESTDDITAGDEYVLVRTVASTGANHAMGPFNSGNYYSTVTTGFVLNDKVVTLNDPTTVNVLTLEDTGDGYFYIKDDAENYLYYSSGNNVHRSQNPNTNAYKWTLSINNNGDVVINNVNTTARYLQANTGNTPRYSCYENTQQNAKLYKKGTSSVPAPQITPAGGTSNKRFESFDVTITAADGCTIYYTTDGSNPTINSTEYTASFELPYGSAPTTVKAIAVDGQGNVSRVTTVVYYWNRATVSISPASQRVTADVNVTITSSPSDAEVTYKVNGGAEQAYSAPFTVQVNEENHSVTVVAIARKGESVATDTVTYTFKSDKVYSIAEFLALDNGEEVTFKSPVTVLFDYSQSASNQKGQEYIWVKDRTGYTQFFLTPAIDHSSWVPKYENGDVIPEGFKVKKNYFSNGSYIQGYCSGDSINSFADSDSKALADPEQVTLTQLLNSIPTGSGQYSEYNNRYLYMNKVKILSKNGLNFTFAADENGNIVNGGTDVVGYNKYNSPAWKNKQGDVVGVTIPDVDGTYYNVKFIFQKWQGGYEVMPIEFTPWHENKVRLEDLVETGVKNQVYTITNPLIVAKVTWDDVKGKFAIFAKDDEAYAHKRNPGSLKSYLIEYEKGDFINTLPQEKYDQSNWVEILIPDTISTTAFTNKTASNDYNTTLDELQKTYEGKILAGGTINGTYIDDFNPTIEMTHAPAKPTSTSTYDPNIYCTANFLISNLGDNGATSGRTDEYGGPYFMMDAKPHEFCKVVWAFFEGTDDYFVAPAREGDDINGLDFKGGFLTDMSLCEEQNVTSESHAKNLFKASDDESYGNEEALYSFNAIVRKNSDYWQSTGGNGAPRRIVPKDDGVREGIPAYIVYPLSSGGNSEIVTAVEDVNGKKMVDSVRYYNLMGQESKSPFEGINIVVTRYTDGSSSTAKVLR
jgi:hypothetical protein